ncbi:helix-turn-helix domain-containing protein [Microbispora siamensis]
MGKVTSALSTQVHRSGDTPLGLLRLTWECFDPRSCQYAGIEDVGIGWPSPSKRASSSGTPVSAIARLLAADEDTVRDVVHAFNEKGLAAPGPQWAGGRPRLISDDDIAFIVATALI